MDVWLSLHIWWTHPTQEQVTSLICNPLYCDGILSFPDPLTKDNAYKQPNLARHVVCHAIINQSHCTGQNRVMSQLN